MNDGIATNQVKFKMNQNFIFVTDGFSPYSPKGLWGIVAWSWT